MYIVQEVHVSSDDCGNNVTDAENLKVYVDISDYIIKMCERHYSQSCYGYNCLFSTGGTRINSTVSLESCFECSKAFG